MLNGYIILSVIDCRPLSRIRLTLDIEKHHIVVQMIDIICYHIVICFICLTSVYSAPGPEHGCLIKGEPSRVRSTFLVLGFILEVGHLLSFPAVFNLFYVSVYPGFY